MLPDRVNDVGMKRKLRWFALQCFVCSALMCPRVHTGTGTGNLDLLKRYSSCGSHQTVDVD